MVVTCVTVLVTSRDISCLAHLSVVFYDVTGDATTDCCLVAIVLCQDDNATSDHTV